MREEIFNAEKNSLRKSELSHSKQHSEDHQEHTITAGTTAGTTAISHSELDGAAEQTPIHRNGSAQKVPAGKDSRGVAQVTMATVSS